MQLGIIEKLKECNAYIGKCFLCTALHKSCNSFCSITLTFIHVMSCDVNVRVCTCICANTIVMYMYLYTCTCNVHVHVYTCTCACYLYFIPCCSCSDNELPDYIMVMLVNKKTFHQIHNDLQLFLGEHTETFMKWLQEAVTTGNITGSKKSKAGRLLCIL